jgi:hypothetical protein
MMMVDGRIFLALYFGSISVSGTPPTSALAAYHAKTGKIVGKLVGGVTPCVSGLLIIAIVFLALWSLASLIRWVLVHPLF